MEPINRSYPDETNLILAASNADLEAFNQLVLRYQDSVFFQAYSMLSDRYAAEDAAQESFIKAFQAIGRFRGGSFRAWLLRIAINTCRDRLRAGKRHPNLPLVREDEDGEDYEPSAWLVDPQPPVHNIVEGKELSSLISLALKELPAIFRDPVTLIDLQELDYAEAAQILAIPVGTLKSRLVRGRLKMKEMLQGYASLPWGSAETPMGSRIFSTAI